jgi:hypothetical protein
MVDVWDRQPKEWLAKRLSNGVLRSSTAAFVLGAKACLATS